MFMQDATRFLLRHYHTITTWPLQIYSSAIIFSPQASVVRTKNLGKIPRWLKKVSPVEDQWASLIQTLAGHSRSVTAVAFSPDGKRIASGSDDQTVKVWDAATGDLEKTLAGHSRSVRAVAFSPDGKRIASGSNDKTIKLWDVAKSLKASRFLGKSIASRFKFQTWQETAVSNVIDNLRFSADGQHLLTNIGPILVKGILTPKQKDNSKSSQYLYVSDRCPSLSSSSTSDWQRTILP